jgi:hypothetical protein
MPFVPGLRDTIVQPLYDSEQIPMAGTTSLRFFTVPLGQNFQSGLRAKTIGDTNMTLAGQLPNPYTHRVYGFRLAFLWNIPQADIVIAINTAGFEFNVGAKPFLQVPARTIPGGNGVYGFYTQAAAATAAILNNGWPSSDNIYKIGRQPQTLSPTENFNIVMTWPAVQALSAAQTVTVYLEGVLRRGAQ